MKDYYPEYIAAKQKLTRLEKKHESLQKKYRTDMREYQVLIHKMRQEIHRLKGYKEFKHHDMYGRILEEYGITEDEIKSSLRDRPIVNIRHAIFYYLRYSKNYNTCQIGAMFDRDHSSVIHGCKNVESWLDMPQIYAPELKILELIHGANDEEKQGVPAHNP